MNELLWHSRTRICGMSPPAGTPGHCRCAAVAFLTIFVGPPSAVWNVHPPFGYSEQLGFFLRIHSSLLLYKVLLLLLYRWVKKRFLSHFDARCKSCRCDRFLYENPACPYPHLFLYLSPPARREQPDTQHNSRLHYSIAIHIKLTFGHELKMNNSSECQRWIEAVNIYIACRLIVTLSQDVPSHFVWTAGLLFLLL